ncbi:MAG: hypothetical protein B0D91_08380, partial [Oceanospirillales bacterium LUC14_002_19_P2]
RKWENWKQMNTWSKNQVRQYVRCRGCSSKPESVFKLTRICIGEASVLKWDDIDFENNVIYLYRTKVNNEDFIPMTKRLRNTLVERQKNAENEYVFPGRYGKGHKTIRNNRALEAAFKRAGVEGVSTHNARKTFATRLLSRGAAITDVQHLLGHASVKTTERAYAAFVKNERFKKTIDLLDQESKPNLKVVK